MMISIKFNVIIIILIHVKFISYNIGISSEFLFNNFILLRNKWILHL